jgi:16S rRNA (uracil1498-N3)-methyltransferase
VNAPHFFLPDSSIDTETNRVRISKLELINQISRVLRKAPGDQIIVLNGKGAVHECCISEITSRHVQAEIIKTDYRDPQIRPNITVCHALLRGGRFEFALQKLTELGVGSIIPLISERGVAKYSGSKLEHWQGVVREAAEQCERVSIPPVVEPVVVKKLMPQLMTTANFSSTLRLICLPRATELTIPEILRQYKGTTGATGTTMPPESVYLMIGPEGDFTSAEISCALECGFTPISLGPRILRSETASICATALLISLMESPEILR